MQLCRLSEFPVTRTLQIFLAGACGLQHQAAVMIQGAVVDPPLDLEAAAILCEDLSSLPSFAFSSNAPSCDFLRDLPDTSFFPQTN